MALHFNSSPSILDIEQILDYLQYLKNNHQTPSDSFFKHTVYGLRSLYKLKGLEHRRIVLPMIKRSKKLPVVLSQSEIRKFLVTPKLLKHRLILAMLYDCGLRCFELGNLKLKDLDFDRKTLHVRQGKGRKDRYVVLGDHLIRGLKNYILSEVPVTWLFNGQLKEETIGALSLRGIQWVVRASSKQSGINKNITAHTLRHSYATHLLEMGLDIVSLKEALGHSCIETTMIYLHVCQLGRRSTFSPLDRMYRDLKA